MSDKSEHFVLRQLERDGLQDSVTFQKVDFFHYSSKEKFNVIFVYDVLEHVTFPALWLMRRVHLFLVPPPANLQNTPIEIRTEKSAFTHDAKKSLMIPFAEALPVWSAAFWLQDLFRRRRLGCNTLILRRRSRRQANSSSRAITSFAENSYLRRGHALSHRNAALNAPAGGRHWSSDMLIQVELHRSPCHD